MEVLFLGAGASCDAGYPRTHKIFDELKNYCLTSFVGLKRQKWQSFEKAKKKINKIARVVIDTNNPELILTLPDLLAAAQNEYESNQIAKADKDLSLFGRCFFDYRRPEKIIRYANTMKSCFEYLLSEYFLYKHDEDMYRQNKNELPGYLTNMFNSVNCIVTTNWDTLAERILLRDGRWHPSDGYGFHVDLHEYDGLTKGDSINAPPSNVNILKLHGSVGWYKTCDEKPYLDARQFLDRFVELDGACDDADPRLGPNEDAVMIYPSYLKQLNNARLLSVWEKASAVLHEATKITIVGYSLPKADVAVRSLLLPIRKKSNIKIVSPGLVNSSDERKRWEEYFSESKVPEFIIETAREYFR